MTKEALMWQACPFQRWLAAWPGQFQCKVPQQHGDGCVDLAPTHGAARLCHHLLCWSCSPALQGSITTLSSTGQPKQLPICRQESTTLPSALILVGINWTSKYILAVAVRLMKVHRVMAPRDCPGEEHPAVVPLCARLQPGSSSQERHGVTLLAQAK